MFNELFPSKRQKELISLIQENSSEWIEEVPALLGNLSGVVDTGTGLVYFRFTNGVVGVAIDRTTPYIFDLQVIVGRSKAMPNTWQVIGVREVYPSGTTTDFIKNHHLQHQFDKLDEVPIDRRQVQALSIRVSDAANFKVTIFGDVLHTATGIKLLPNQEIDLSSYRIGAGAKYVSFECDDEAAVTVHDGTPQGSIDLLTEADIPTPDAGKYFLGYCLFYDGQPALSNDNIRVPLSLSIGANGTAFQIHSASAITELQSADEFGVWNSLTEAMAKITWENLASFLFGSLDHLAITYNGTNHKLDIDMAEPLTDDDCNFLFDDDCNLLYEF